MDTDRSSKNRIQLSDHFTYRRLFAFVLPTIANMIFLSVYGIIDGLFISNCVGKVAFASVNVVFPIFSVLGVFGLMVGTGGSAIIGKTLGEQKPEKANGYFSFFVYACIIIGVIMAVLGMFVLRPAIRLLGVEPDMIDPCMEYGIIGMFTVPCFMLQFLFQILFVTAEKPRLGFWITISAGITNIVLDFFFVYLFHWGVAGAAVATDISEVVGGIVPLIYFVRPNNSLLQIGRPDVDFRALLKACTNGLSELVSTVSESVVSMLYNFQLLRIAGSDGVAAFGVMEYCTFIFFAIFAGYNMGVQPLFSYNYGADNRDEMKNLFRKSIILMEGFGLVMLALLFFFARPLVSVFVGYDADLVDLTVHGIRIYSLLFITCGIQIFATGMFTALNNGLVSAICATVRVVVCEISSVMILPIFFGLNGIWCSAPVAEAGSILVVFFFVIRLRRRYGYA
ncbi:MAG: MATE family efflux transporter [Firmicutes bacterium]|nr:MATE family efflux transporter [Bacillota bacterium]MBQ9016594.1 MATE family efflux transporter [Bacillota bacterium]